MYGHKRTATVASKTHKPGYAAIHNTHSNTITKHRRHWAEKPKSKTFDYCAKVTTNIQRYSILESTKWNATWRDVSAKYVITIFAVYGVPDASKAGQIHEIQRKKQNTI